MYYGEFIEEVNELKSKTDRLYIYGAGMRGTELCHILTRNNIQIEGFIVTQAREKTQMRGYPIVTANTIIHENIGIIVGLSDIYAKEVMQYLAEQKVDFDRIVDGGKYISIDRGSKILQDNPTVEITTVMGCGVTCRYCPQKVLLAKYFEKDKNRKRIMSLEDFRIFLEHTPDNCDIMFAGMSEPYLNSDCTEMLKMAFDAGRNVSLFTTLEGGITEGHR